MEIHNHAIFDNNTTLDMVGPSTSKPNGTWTRINRMDFGLGGLTRAITIPGLGRETLVKYRWGKMLTKLSNEGK